MPHPQHIREYLLFSSLLPILTGVPFLVFLITNEKEGLIMAVYDWTGQRARRRKMMRAASVAMLLIILMAIPAILLHYNLIQFPY
jgi:hypothetical protein